MTDGWDYPVFLGFGFLFLAGYFARTVFLSLRLPAVVGVILVGMAYSTFMQDDILSSRDTLQEFAFFLVLLKAGLEISLQDLTIATVLLAWVPVTIELVGLALYAVLLLHFTWIEAFILGTVLCCLGEGLVIPKMNELGRAFPEHPLPRLVFTCAPLEASYALTMFGIFSGFAKPAGEEVVPVGLVLAANVLRIAFTVTAGAVLGALVGLLVPRRTRLTILGRQVFTGAAVEAFLIVLGVALVAFGLGMDRDSGRALLPMGFAPGSVFSPELLVICFGASLAATVHPDELHDVETTLGGVWIFGQIVLFSMLGSKTSVDAFRAFPRVLPLMLTGFVCRAIGVRAVIAATRRWRTCSRGCQVCVRANTRSAIPDTVFCFISSLPRATLQGALAGVPLRKRYFLRSDSGGAAAAQFMADAGKIYIPLLAIVGSLVLDFLGPRLLRVCSARAQRHQEAEAVDREQWCEGWKRRFRASSYRSGVSFRSAGSTRIDLLNCFEAYVCAGCTGPSRRTTSQSLSAIGLSSDTSSCPQGVSLG